MPVIAAVILAAAAIGGGVMSSMSASKSARANAKSIADTNALNLRIFEESRGSTGHAILPLYAGDNEQLAMEDAFKYYKALGVTPPAELMAKYQALIDQQQASIMAGNRLIENVSTGAVGQEMLGQQMPVSEARTAQAATIGTGVDIARQRAEAALAASEAAKGYTGTGSFAQSRMLATAIPYHQQAAGAKAAAELANTLDVQRIQEAGRQLQLANLNVPVQRAQQLISLSQMPAMNTALQAKLQQQPLEFFKLNPGTPPPMTAPQVPAVENPWAAVATGVGQGAAGIAAANQQAATNKMWQDYMASQAKIASAQAAYYNSKAGISTVPAGPDESTYLGPA